MFLIKQAQSYLPWNQCVAKQEDPKEEGVFCSLPDDMWHQIVLKSGDPLTFACVSKRLYGVCMRLDPVSQLPERIQEYLKATFSADLLKSPPFVYTKAYERLKAESEALLGKDAPPNVGSAGMTAYHKATRSLEAINYWAFYSVVSGEPRAISWALYCFRAEETIRTEDSWQSFLHITKLVIDKLPVVSLPEEIGCFTNLTNLRIKHQPLLNTLPASITQLQGLRSFEIDDCRSITSLPEAIGALSSLTYLRIAHTAIKALPSSIGNLQSLNTFTIVSCPLESLPDTMSRLTSIDWCALSQLPALSSLPPTFGSGLRNVRWLFLNNVGISSIPASIGEMRALQKLVIENNPNLTSIPCTITELPRLRNLDISQNTHLTSLPDNIGHLRTLETLELHGNPCLTELPHTINQLQAQLVLPKHIDPYHPLLVDYPHSKEFR